MIDLHSHILPGLDDGAQTVEESVALARAASAAGIRAIAGTPHVREDYPTDANAMEQALAAVRAGVEQAGIPIRILGGGELALDRLDHLTVGELRRFGLGGNPAYLLVEMPYLGWPRGLEESFRKLQAEGITPVLAHPERNPEVQIDLGRLGRLAQSGTLVQLTAASVDGRAGRRARAAALELISRGAAHLIASDAHNPQVRRVGFEDIPDALRDPPLVYWLTNDVPSAIVNGTPIPARPEPARRWSLRSLRPR